jgi:hypothetical protein
VRRHHDSDRRFAHDTPPRTIVEAAASEFIPNSLRKIAMKSVTIRRPLSYAVVGFLFAAVAVRAAEPTAPPVYRSPASTGRIAAIDLTKLNRRLIDVLAEMHVERDPSDPQFGMIYETYDPQRKIWVEAEGRDTMHHLMWTMIGLANAYRATGEAANLEFLTKYPLAFYLHLMHDGEKLFGSEYGNGFCPYYWDDGDSFNLGPYLRGMPLGDDARINGFSPMSSVHMAQDLSVGHLDLWWLFQDEKIRRAASDLYHQVHQGKTAERFAARNYAMTVLKLHPADDLARFQEGLVEGKAWLMQKSEAERRALYAKQFPPTYGPIITAAQKTLSGDKSLPAMEPLRHAADDTVANLRLRQRKAGGVPAFPDDTAFSYYLELCRAAPDRSIRDWFARWFTMELLSRALLNEYWLDDAAYPAGYAHFPGFNTTWNMKDGRFVTYHSQTPRHFWHTRGIHYAWLSALALQMMDQWPEMHEEYRREVGDKDVVVRFNDRTPALDGEREPNDATVFDSADVGLHLASDPLSLFVFVEQRGADSVDLTIYDGLEAGEHRAAVHVVKSGDVRVVNGAGTELLHWTKRTAKGVEIQIPYQIYRPQGDWMTAVEHGRNRVVLRCRGGVAAETEASQNVYFLSDADRIKRRLQTFVEETIVNHAEILDRQGWLPYAIADKSSDPFTRLSFSGAYGHLIHTIAQYQLWQQHRRDWDAKRDVHAKLP